ncbi:MAG: UDP-N-acetylmuramate--L-alanine ligase [Holosporales bacterium]|jgi:UDP-N-acetylmuramate--alanine ligase|nr:UDP-N-acetylmuramate--L-alanine ligase [Holosporales bacterium]
MLSVRNDYDNIVIHFIGLGGIGMSGLAEILHSLGYIVQGSDKSKSQNIDRLEKLGITAFIGHTEKNIENTDIIVYSSAINPNNPELRKARALKIPCLSRAEMLSQLVRFKKSIVVAGSHGKTTVTSICAAILEMASLDPTVVNGGIINSYKTNAKLGSGDWVVIESDESDGSFIKFFPTIGIITNIDREHITHYGGFDNLKTAFRTFFNNLPFYGSGIACVDDENVAELVRDITDRRIVTYSIEKDSMFKAINIRKTENGAVFDVRYGKETISDISIPLLGDHNIRNTLSAIAMSYELRINIDIVKFTLASFAGVSRRFTKIGEIEKSLIIDDYAHHPTEIRALLDSARQRTTGKILLICQPHRFTRLNTLFDEFRQCFEGADIVIILPVYKADDTESAKITSDDLYNELKNQGKAVFFVTDKDELESMLQTVMRKEEFGENDIVLFAGAGSISKFAHEIVSKIGICT